MIFKSVDNIVANMLHCDLHSNFSKMQRRECVLKEKLTMFNPAYHGVVERLKHQNRICKFQFTSNLQAGSEIVQLWMYVHYTFYFIFIHIGTFQCVLVHRICGWNLKDSQLKCLEATYLYPGGWACLKISYIL